MWKISNFWRIYPEVLGLVQAYTLIEIGAPQALSLRGYIFFCFFVWVCLTYIFQAQSPFEGSKSNQKAEVLRFLHDIINKAALTSELNSPWTACHWGEKMSFSVGKERTEWGRETERLSVGLPDSCVIVRSVRWLLSLPNRLSPVVSASSKH